MPYSALTACTAFCLLDIGAMSAKEDLTRANKQETRRRIEASAAEA